MLRAQCGPERQKGRVGSSDPKWGVLPSLGRLLLTSSSLDLGVDSKESKPGSVRASPVCSQVPDG